MAYYFNFLLIQFCGLVYFIICADAHGPTLNSVLFNGSYEFIDLTHPFDKNTIYWPDSETFSFTKKYEAFGKDGTWYAANNFAAGEHGGTHIDAPYHFQVNGKRIGEIPLDKLIVPLIIADVSSKVSDDPNFILQKHHLDYMLNDNFGKPCVLIFKFGWSKFFFDRNKYLGVNENGTLNFPGMLKWGSGRVDNGFLQKYCRYGVDTASIDPGSTTDYPAHKISSKAGLFNLENVKLDVSFPDYGCTALILPMKIALGTGAPLRLVAICPKQTPTHF